MDEGEVSPLTRHRHEAQMTLRNRQGLYDPQDERDACGFGMVAQLDDQPSRLLVDTAIAALSRMTHRGGVAVRATRPGHLLCRSTRGLRGT